jgi:16S rRNA (guanine527-N7)-methyltransferase
LTEGEAKAWLRDRFGVSREARLARLADLVRAEAHQQNLIAPSTLESIWVRHIVDSAQLLTLTDGDRAGLWLDIGTGAGFPGLVIACLRNAPILLCEPRKRRAEFLATAVDALDIADHTSVSARKVEGIADHASIISARAVAPLDAMIASAAHLSDRDTLWLLPKGRGAREEVAVACKTWQGSFHVEQSLTQSDSLIVVATGVVRR